MFRSELRGPSGSYRGLATGLRPAYCGCVLMHYRPKKTTFETVAPAEGPIKASIPTSCSLTSKSTGVRKGKRSVRCAGGFVLGSAPDRAAPGHQPPSLVVTAMADDAATGTAVLNGGLNKGCCALNGTFTGSGTLEEPVKAAICSTGCVADEPH